MAAYLEKPHPQPQRPEADPMTDPIYHRAAEDARQKTGSAVAVVLFVDDRGQYTVIGTGRHDGTGNVERAQEAARKLQKAVTILDAAGAL